MILPTGIDKVVLFNRFIVKSFEWLNCTKFHQENSPNLTFFQILSMFDMTSLGDLNGQKSIEAKNNQKMEILPQN